MSDVLAAERGLLEVEVGDPGIKGVRRRRKVNRSPFGVVADYAPFYFAPRSPMLFSIDKGNVPSYQDGCDPLVYLVSTVEGLVQAGLDVLVSDRNACLATATFRLASDDLDDHVDWELMQARIWRDTADHPDRKERRMAECLAHSQVPWSAVTAVVARTSTTAAQASGVLWSAGVSQPVSVRPGWYF